MGELVMKSHVCKTCNEVFVLTEAHEQWYLRNELQIPKRCPACVAKRKASNPARVVGNQIEKCQAV